jgi:hypothetical protein
MQLQHPDSFSGLDLSKFSLVWIDTRHSRPRRLHSDFSVSNTPPCNLCHEMANVYILPWSFEIESMGSFIHDVFIAIIEH